MASPTVAANAYASLARMMERGGAEKGGQAAAGPSFGALVKEAVGSVMEAGKKSDAQTMAMSSGKANVMDVVTAVAESAEPMIIVVRHRPSTIAYPASK